MAHQPPSSPPRVTLIQFPANNTIHRVFTVYSPEVTFTSDSGATDILIRECDAHILTQYTPYTDNASPPGFDVANYNQIFPIAHGKLSIPNTQITLDAFVFHDDDLHSNLFGIAPLTQHGLSATYTNTELQISAPTTHGPKIIIYGVKNLNANVWRFSLPKAQHYTAHQVVRHEQNAELVLYASATFGSPPTKTFYKAVVNGWLTNYPTLTAEMIRKNQPHSPATALGHITIARSGIRSSQPKSPTSKVLVTTRSQAASLPAPLPSAPDPPVRSLPARVLPVYNSKSPPSLPAESIEHLCHYQPSELPTTTLQTRLLPPSELRDSSMFSDLTGRFPATAMDGSQYILLSIYKTYIHLELLPNHTEASLILAYNNVHTWFATLGHYIRFQVLDNEAPKGLQLHFRAARIPYECVPPYNKRAIKAERAIQTFKRHFITILAGTHPSFPINFWHELIPQAEMTLNMMRPYADQPPISAYHGIHRRPFDFASHPLAPCGTLVVIHNSIRETWDNFGLVGFYLGPSLKNYRSYRCLVQETMSIRISDSIILYPAPLVAPGASRLDQLLSLTSKLHALADGTAQDPASKTQLLEGLQLLKKFLANDPHNTTVVPTLPTTSSTRHRASSDTGIDILGWTFKEKTLGPCTVVSTDTLLDDNNIVWNTLQLSSSKTKDTFVAKVSEVRTWIRRDKSACGPPAKTVLPDTDILRDTLPEDLRHPLEAHSPFRAILLPPRSVPAVRLRLPAKSSRDERRRFRAHSVLSAKVRFSGPDSTDSPKDLLDTLNLDPDGKPLTYSSAKRGPDRLAWAKAEAEEIIRLIMSGTIIPIPHTMVLQERWNTNEIVYYNPVVKQKRNDDGSIQFRVRGTAGGNLLTIPYDVSARTASLDTVKLLIHSVISDNYSWMTIDIADFYLGTPLPASRYEYLRIHLDKIPPEIIDKYNLTPLLYNKHVYFEIRKCMYGLPQAGKLSQTRLIRHLSTHGYIQCPNTPCLFRHVTRDIMFSLVVDDFGVRGTL